MCFCCLKGASAGVIACVAPLWKPEHSTTATFLLLEEGVGDGQPEALFRPHLRSMTHLENHKKPTILSLLCSIIPSNRQHSVRSRRNSQVRSGVPCSHTHCPNCNGMVTEMFVGNAYHPAIEGTQRTPHPHFDAPTRFMSQCKEMEKPSTQHFCCPCECWAAIWHPLHRSPRTRESRTVLSNKLVSTASSFTSKAYSSDCTAKEKDVNSKSEKVEMESRKRCILRGNLCFSH